MSKLTDEKLAELRALYDAKPQGELWVDEEGTVVRLPGGGYCCDFDDRTERDFYVDAHNAFPALLSEFEAARKVVVAAGLAQPELKQYLEDIGGCDHSVGICCCSLGRAVDSIDAAIAAHKEATK